MFSDELTVCRVWWTDFVFSIGRLFVLLVSATVSVTASTITAEYTAASYIPVTAAGYTATGNDVALSLGFAPPRGTDLTIVENTGLSFISGQFSNLAQGQEVRMVFNGTSYVFVANYFGGSGNDLVLQWPVRGIFSWGSNSFGQVGDGSTLVRNAPVVPLDQGLFARKSFVAVSGGMLHSLALCSDGTLTAWGSNRNGRLGDGTATDSKIPINVTSSGVLLGRRVIAIAAGSSHSLALCSDGKVASWGNSASGVLGRSGATTVPGLVDTAGVLLGKTVVAISSTGGHCLALCSDGTLVSWGSNSFGQLGNNSVISSSVPVAVEAGGVLSGKTVVEISAGGLHSMARCSDGTVVTWGSNSSGQLGNNSTVDSSVPVLVSTGGVLAGRTVTQIAAGTVFGLARCSDGSVVSWGANSSGQLGNNGTAHSSVPVLLDMGGVLLGKSISAVSSGFTHAFAATSDGTFVAWGDNAGGQLGNNSTVDANTPVLVSDGGLFAGAVIKRMAGGAVHSLMLAAVPASSKLSSLAVSAIPPLQLASMLDRIGYFVRLAPGATQISLIPTALDTAVVKVGGVPVLSGNASAPVALLPGFNRITIEVSGEGGSVSNYTAGVVVGSHIDVTFSSAGDVPFNGEEVVCTGLDIALSLNFAPALGTNLTLIRKNGVEPITGNFANLARGQVVELPYNGKLYRFAANYYGGTGNDLVLEWADRSLASWGNGVDGRLGTGSNVSSLLPVPVDQSGVLAGKTVVSLASSASCTLALCADGTLASWGNNFYGQLGIGAAPYSLVPVAINSMGTLAGKEVVSIAAGNATSLAVCSDGTVATWGLNSSGMLGDGTTTNRNIPVAVISTGVLAGRKVVAGAVGGSHTLVLCSDGKMVTWGQNGSGQLGTADTNNYNFVPVNVVSSGVLIGKKVTAIGAGMTHSLALCADGTLVAWGDNFSGQLGTGNNTPQYTPVAVNTAGVLAGKTVIGLSVSTDGNLLQCSDSTLVTFGSGTSGELGNGTGSSSKLPVAVNSTGVLAGKSPVSVSVGNGCCFVACSDGSAVAWGANSQGQLGDGSTTKRSLPVAVDSSGWLFGKAVLAHASGGLHSHAIVAEPADGYVHWMAGQTGLTNMTDLGDPDSDGVANLMEYTLAGNPAVSSTSILPVLSADGDYFVFNFSRLASSESDTEQIFQYSSDMIHWTNLKISSPTDPAVTIGTTDGNGNQSVTVTVPKAANARIFGRLKVNRP